MRKSNKSAAIRTTLYPYLRHQCIQYFTMSFWIGKIDAYKTTKCIQSSTSGYVLSLLSPLSVLLKVLSKTLPIYIVPIISSRSSSFGKRGMMFGLPGIAPDWWRDFTDCTFPCDEQMIVIPKSLKGHGCHLNKEIKKHIFPWETM